MARRSEYVQHLSGIELFADLSKAELSKVAAAGNEVTFSAGSTLVDQGDIGRTMYVLLDGEAVVRRGTRKVATVGVGAPVGELALLDHGPRTAYVIAETDVTALAIDAKAFKQLLSDMPKLALKLLGTLAARVRELDRKAFG